MKKKRIIIVILLIVCIVLSLIAFTDLFFDGQYNIANIGKLQYGNSIIALDQNMSEASECNFNTLNKFLNRFEKYEKLDYPISYSNIFRRSKCNGKVKKEKDNYIFDMYDSKKNQVNVTYILNKDYHDYYDYYELDDGFIVYSNEYNYTEKNTRENIIVPDIYVAKHDINGKQLWGNTFYGKVDTNLITYYTSYVEYELAAALQDQKYTLLVFKTLIYNTKINAYGKKVVLPSTKKSEEKLVYYKVNQEGNIIDKFETNQYSWYKDFKIIDNYLYVWAFDEDEQEFVLLKINNLGEEEKISSVSDVEKKEMPDWEALNSSKYTIGSLVGYSISEFKNFMSEIVYYEKMGTEPTKIKLSQYDISRVENPFVEYIDNCFWIFASKKTGDDLYLYLYIISKEGEKIREEQLIDSSMLYDYMDANGWYIEYGVNKNELYVIYNQDYSKREDEERPEGNYTIMYKTVFDLSDFSKKTTSYFRDNDNSFIIQKENKTYVFSKVKINNRSMQLVSIYE